MFFGQRNEARFAALVNGLNERAGDLGAGTVAEGQALLDEWTSIFEASVAVKSAKGSAEAQQRDARRALGLELFKNLLAIAQLHPGQPEKLPLYMQKHLLQTRRHRRNAVEETAQ